jgi:hypothetical protein
VAERDEPLPQGLLELEAGMVTTEVDAHGCR